MEDKRIILPILPQTHVRSTKGDKIIFRIPEDCRKLKGKKPCAKFRKTGDCEHILSKGGRDRKRRLEKYNEYKIALKSMCDQAGFVIPTCGWAMYFYVPIPTSYKQWKKDLLHGQLKYSEPDIDNYEKAFYDAMKIRDETIAQLSGHGKFWFDPDKVSHELRHGYIELLLDQTIYNPFNVEILDYRGVVEKRKRRLKRKSSETPRPKRKPKPLRILHQEQLFSKPDKIM